MVLELKEFIEDCKNGNFIDYDGFGYYSNSRIVHEDNDDLRVYPSRKKPSSRSRVTSSLWKNSSIA